jgi:ferritin
MISNALVKTINEQINKDLVSAYLYLSMSAYFEGKNLPGFANWMKVQAEEEQAHAMKFFAHLVERGAKVELKAIAAPQVDWKTNLDVVKQVKEHEILVTASINAIYEQAITEKDYPVQIMLQWFINEQVEEEKNADDLVHQVGAVDGNTLGLVMLDQYLGKRGAD